MCAGARGPEWQAEVQAWAPSSAIVSGSDNGEQTNHWAGRPPRGAGDEQAALPCGHSHSVQCFSEPLSVQVRGIGILHEI